MFYCMVATGQEMVRKKANSSRESQGILIGDVCGNHVHCISLNIVHIIIVCISTVYCT